MTALRRTTISAAAVALVAVTVLGLGLHARHASGAFPGAAASPASSSVGPTARPPWALGGFRDGESWRETSPSPDAI
jgi:hypothetical protein